ncbi:MAG: hypothetical protein KJZ58_12435 [Flavobacteriales bacterium]|nr:hypothetical protein [Flavobacteriales bacterium]
MRRLEDHERGAFHYLAGGLAAVLLLQAAAYLSSLRGTALDADHALLVPFQQGYSLLRGQWACVATASTLVQRLVTALVAGVGSAFLLALALLLWSSWRKRPGSRPQVMAIRCTLAIVFLWSAYAAYFVPLRETRVERGAVVIRERKALMGDIPVPFTTVERRLPAAEVLRIEGGHVPAGPGRQGEAWLDLATAGGKVRIGRMPGIPADQELVSLWRASSASAVLERELR